MSANREAKLQQVLQLFRAGSYRVDPDAVADAIMQRFSSSAGSGRVPSRDTGRARLRSVLLVGAGSARTRAL
ncbi:MAG: hypothetical protein ACJ764_02405 [Solirubrobacteraceae bacterium]